MDSSPKSELIGKGINNNVKNFKLVSYSAKNIANALPMTVGASTYFSADPFIITSNDNGAGFIDEIYKRIYRPWIDVAQMGPSYSIDVKLPPFISIVLSRANFRDQIPEVLSELREELTDVCNDLKRMNQMLDSSISQAEIDAFVMSQNFVEKRLKAPSTAEFCSYSDATVLDLGDGRFRVSAYVNAENSFGAKVRTTYICVLKSKDGDTWTLERLNM